MTRKPNKKLIGFFIFVGLIIFIISILFFASNKIYKNGKDLIVMYFKESIQGLKVGSPVVFRGVEIGKVVKINLIADKDNLDLSIPVYIKIDKEEKLKSKTNKLFNNKNNLLKKLIEKGLRARLATYSFITGQLMIEIEILPNSKFELISDKKNILEIPTVLSSKGALSESLEDLKINEIINNINVLLIYANKYLPNIFKNIDNITSNINELLPNNLNVDKEFTIKNINKTINTLDDTLKSIKNFVDYIDRNPEALLKGRGGNY